MALFTINGLDILPYIDQAGLEFTRNDIEAPGSGRNTMNGEMVRGRITTKEKINVALRPLTQEESQIVLNAIFPEYVTVECMHPRLGQSRFVMYSNNVPSVCQRIQEDGTPLWTGIKFPLIER